MAAGGENGCRLAKDEELQQQLRELWKDWLQAQDVGQDLLHKAEEGPPLYFRLLRRRTTQIGSFSGELRNCYPWELWNGYLGHLTFSRST